MNIVQSSQRNKNPSKMSSPIKLRNTIALLVGIGLGAIALAQSVSADLHVPAARIIAAECQGFEALATVGGKPLTCSPAAVVAEPHAAVLAETPVAVTSVAGVHA